MTSAEYKSVIRLDTVLLPSRRERMEFLLIASDVQVRGTYEVAYTSYSRVCPPSLALACAKSKIVAGRADRTRDYFPSFQHDSSRMGMFGIVHVNFIT